MFLFWRQKLFVNPNFDQLATRLFKNIEKHGNKRKLERTVEYYDIFMIILWYNINRYKRETIF